MFIKQINIDSFGCITDKKIDFSHGFNVIYGPNESGKTTLMAFIVFAFYGTKIKKKNTNLAFKEKYTPWNGNAMSGEIVFEYAKSTYSLKRTYSPVKKEITLFCLDTGEHITDRTILDDVGGYFFGVGAESFYKTVFLSSLSADISGEKPGEIISILSNLVETGSEEVSYRQISDIINEEILSLSSPKRKGAIIPNLEHKLLDLRTKLSEYNKAKEQALKDSDDAKKLDVKINQLDGEIRALKQQKEDAERIDEPYHDKKTLNTIIGCLFFALLGIACIFINMVLSVFSFITAASCGIISLKKYCSYKKMLQRCKERKVFTITKINDKMYMLQDELSSLKVNKAILIERSKINVSQSTENIDFDINNTESELKHAQKRLNALLLAQKAVDSAYQEIKSEFSPSLTRRTSEIFARICGNKYDSLIIDDMFSVNVRIQSGYAASSQMSRGTYEQIYLSLRLALSDMIFKKDVVPAFLDEAFVYYDLSRFKEATRYLFELSHKRQIFFSTCRYDEYMFLKEENANIIQF